MTNYWYDADGERTVKTSGESDQVYVNSEFAGGRTNTAKFSLYVSPYLVANQGGRYTKHIYIGSQRVVSKIGDFDSYGSDPRRIQYAGSETDGLSVDYKAKYTGQLQVIKDNYATFAVPYNGEDNNDYVDGKGFCCNDGAGTGGFCILPYISHATAVCFPQKGHTGGNVCGSSRLGNRSASVIRYG